MDLLGVKLIEDKKVGDFENFNIKEVFKIDTYNNGGHSVPRYHTRKGVYVGISTLAECKKAFDFIQLDNGTLADGKQISHVSDNGWSLIAHFYNTDITANIARSKKKMIEHLISGLSEA
ncbi:hypothetical protein [Paenibacillus shenyangensis]|uniref:hypothetical protein n=1 Tax=Paenibacillus sp. A9 TaxID=1284352 RepID=UPI00037B5950|nr:hypothetical protein [Paenibacillus sp. A9]